MSKLIIGCGYLGARLANLWAGRGEEVFVSTRSTARAPLLRDQGWQPILLDVTQKTPMDLPAVQTLVFAVGFDRSAPHSIYDVYVSGLENVLRNCPASVKRLVYISSTGVYGQSDGGWVDEQSECVPTRDGGKACLAAEQLLLQRPDMNPTVFRLSGIYGPGRLPQAAVLERGEPLQVAAEAYLNLIHVDDGARIIAACERLTHLPRILCVSDGQPVIRGDFYRYLARLLGTAAPRFEPPPSQSARAQRASGSKRVSNQRLISTLDLAGLSPRFLFPSYREGLESILGEAGG